MAALVTCNQLCDGRDWPAAPAEVRTFHGRLPAYAPTLLVDAPRLADSLGVGRVLVKTETQRMGLPSFKILGASWATYRAVCAHLGGEPPAWANIYDLAASLRHLRPMTLAAATDGNHGRAVAFMARLLGFEAHILVPAGTSQARMEAIRGESAAVTVVDGTYDDAIERSAEMAGEHCLVVSDTSWPGYETIPADVAAGYATIFAEVDDALAREGLGPLDMVTVPVGVGALMAAAVTHYRSGPHRPLLVSVEPDDANCVQASTIAGEITATPGPHRSIMVGLNCGMPSPLAWPLLASGVDWCVSVDSDAASRAMTDLADSQVVAGETGAASLAGLRALLQDSHGAAALGDPAEATVLVLVTEGATDPQNYERIVGQPASALAPVLTAA